MVHNGTSQDYNRIVELINYTTECNLRDILIIIYSVWLDCFGGIPCCSTRD